VTPHGHDARAAATPCGRARCPDVLARRGRESRGDRHGACAAQIHAAAAVSSFGKGRGRRQPAGSGPGRSARVVGGAPHPGRRSRAAPRPLDLRARAAPVCRRRAVGAAPRPHLAPAEDALPRLEPWPNKPLVAPLRWLLAVPWGQQGLWGRALGSRRRRPSISGKEASIYTMASDGSRHAARTRSPRQPRPSPPQRAQRMVA